MNDLIVDALVEIGNHKNLVKTCEPNVAEPMKLKKWMVVRTLKALVLFENEWESSTNTKRGSKAKLLLQALGE